MSILNEIRARYGTAGDTDSYKFSHPAQYEESVSRLMSHIFSRGSDKFDAVQFFGLQLIVKEYLLDRMTHEQVDNIIAFQESHLFGVKIPKLETALRAVVDDYDGYMPLRIRAIPEGTVVPTKQLLATVESAVEGRAHHCINDIHGNNDNAPLGTYDSSNNVVSHQRNYLQWIIEVC